MKKNEYIVCYIQKIAYLCNVIKRETVSPIWLQCSLTYWKQLAERVTKVGKECE